MSNQKLNNRRLMNDGWSFSKHQLGATLQQVLDAKTEWHPVDLPHDWLIYNTYDLYETGEGWYRRTLSMEELKTKERYTLRFEGVYMNSTLYVNGKVAGEWKYGYSTFEFDITEFLTEGDNEIVMQVIYESPNSRWYSGAGIYRNVWFHTYPEVHINPDGIYISTEKVDEDFYTLLTTELSSLPISMEPKLSVPEDLHGLDKDFASSIELRHTVWSPSHELVCTHTVDVTKEVTKNAFYVQDSKLHIISPLLWELETPNLYQVQTDILKDNTVIQTITQNIGFRTIEYTCEEGFFLNGNHVKLYGVCQHHDLGSLGAAINRTALKRQLSILKEMGVNAIRTSHNMPAVELMELADEMGFLINSEAFDIWERSKTTYDYARFFPEWSEKDVASWIRRDRNHPSLIMWSIGNEIYDTHADERGQEVTRMLLSFVREHDYRLNAPVTIGSNYMAWENAQKCADIVKLAGYNYAERLYPEHHELHPDWMIYGSETASTLQSRGIYHFPYSKAILADDDEQCSSLGNTTSSWGARSTEYCITKDRDATFSAGQFIWTGWDYIGEPTPYFTKNSYFGQVDTAGFKKDTFYIYQAEWTDYRKSPMVHLFPYWDFSKEQMIDIRVCSNAPKVELFYNEKSLGTYDIDHKYGTQLCGHWQLPYEEGILKAVAYDELGNIIATDSRTSFGDAANIKLSPDKTTLLANSQDLIFVEISMEDCNGNPVENANNRVTVDVSGAGRLIGLDNGDSTDYDQYKGISRRLFSGKLLAVIASTLTPGEITMKVSSETLPTKTLTFTSIPCEYPEGLSDCMRNTDHIIYPVLNPNVIIPTRNETEIPIRKLEIVTPNGTTLTKDLSTIECYVITHPANATYQDIDWRITNGSGIDSNLAKLENDGTKVKVIALGSGKAYLRCTCRNGADKVRMISEVELNFNGLGEATMNPYEFIYGGLYSWSNTNLTNGIERGISSLLPMESYICFKNVDFGSYGSDEITVPIYCLNTEPPTFEIWEGIPHEEGSELLADCIFTKKPIWNHHQPETYKLKRRVKGIVTISFVVFLRLSVQGFQFTKPEKGFAKLFATDCDLIYGDTFTKKAPRIEGIGNNVSLEFSEMDFGEKGITKLSLCGHSPIEKNTIHVKFVSEEDNIVELAEFNFTNDYEVKEFEFSKKTGKYTVTFLFLPGSNFDFEWFQFA